MHDGETERTAKTEWGWRIQHRLDQLIQRDRRFVAPGESPAAAVARKMNLLLRARNTKIGAADESEVADPDVLKRKTEVSEAEVQAWLMGLDVPRRETDGEPLKHKALMHVLELALEEDTLEKTAPDAETLPVATTAAPDISPAERAAAMTQSELDAVFAPKPVVTQVQKAETPGRRVPPQVQQERTIIGLCYDAAAAAIPATMPPVILTPEELEKANGGRRKNWGADSIPKKDVHGFYVIDGVAGRHAKFSNDAGVANYDNLPHDQLEKLLGRPGLGDYSASTPNPHEFLTAWRLWQSPRHGEPMGTAEMARRGEFLNGTYLNYENGMHLPNRDNMKKIRLVFGKDKKAYARFVDLLIESRLGIMDCAEAEGKSLASQTELKSMPREFWQASIDRINDPQAWAARTDKPAWMERTYPVRNQGNYFYVLRNLLGWPNNKPLAEELNLMRATEWVGPATDDDGTKLIPSAGYSLQHLEDAHHDDSIKPARAAREDLRRFYDKKQQEIIAKEDCLKIPAEQRTPVFFNATACDALPSGTYTRSHSDRTRKPQEAARGF